MNSIGKLTMKFEPTEDTMSNSRMAHNLRNLADEVERGDIRSVTALAITKFGNIDLYVRFSSRVEMLGALEYAKVNISNERD